MSEQITKRRFDVMPENDIPTQPIKVSRSGSQSFRVKYYKNRIMYYFTEVEKKGK